MTPISGGGRSSHLSAPRGRVWREGPMALVKDIREKVVKAIKGGMSRRQAAARFDVGPATAVRWAKRVETTGDVEPMKLGGDRRSPRIEAHAEVILKEIKTKPDTQ